MSLPRPFLYLKAGCPWCEEAVAFLKKHNIAYDSVDVRSDAAARAELEEVSGQTKAPTMRWGDEILADFGAEELEIFLRQHGAIQ